MGINNLHDYMGRVEHAVRDNLNGATTLAIIEVERHEREGYWERAYMVAWRNSKEFGTHRVGIDSNDTAACMWGHYLKTKEEAVSDLLDRSHTVNDEIIRLKGEWRKADDGWIAAKEEIERLKKDGSLAVWYTPDAIREHFSEGYDDPDEEQSAVVKWVKDATDEQLREVGSACLGNDSLWREFHHTIDSEVRWAIFEKHKGDNHPGNTSGEAKQDA